MFRGNQFFKFVSTNLPFSSQKFSTVVVKTQLPTLMTSFSPKTIETKVKSPLIDSSVGQQVLSEFKENIFAKDLLLNAEKLVSENKLSIVPSSSWQESQDNYLKKSALFYYDNKEKKISLPDHIDTPYAIMPFLKSPYHNFHNDKLSYFVGAFLHETLHAVDDILAELSVTAKDRAYIQEEYEWLVTGTDFEYYEKPEMRSFCQSIIADKLSLNDKISKGDMLAKRFLHFINLIDQSYSKYDFLDEMKAFLIQFSVKGAFEATQVQKYLPAMSDWYFKTFIPLVQQKVIQEQQTNKASIKIKIK